MIIGSQENYLGTRGDRSHRINTREEIRMYTFIVRCDKIFIALLNISMHIFNTHP